MKKLFMLLIAICAISLGMSAQQVVRGQVTDATGEPLIGATIQPVGGEDPGSSRPVPHGHYAE